MDFKKENYTTVNPEKLRQEFILFFDECNCKKTAFELVVNMYLEQIDDFSKLMCDLLNENANLNNKIAKILGTNSNIGETMALAEVIMSLKAVKDDIRKKGGDPYV